MEKNSDLIKVYDDESETCKFVKRDKGVNKQLLTIEEMLAKFGLLKNEIKVYLHLARMGEKKAGEIAEAISLHRTETYRILRDLEKKGIIFSVFLQTFQPLSCLFWNREKQVNSRFRFESRNQEIYN